ncbi:MAG: mechanosensitive ion channel family protein [Desulfobulbaceae bacterium]|nr:mechanosensitive ion channel family protein [Desulfobulbaceae bacterium]HIJ89795.1 mechanosensitive ion channel family protein [Deltaproteobacteria bacterium]
MEQQLEALHTIANRAITFLVDYSFQVVGAIIILIGGFLLGNWVATAVGKLCEKRGIDVTLGHFLSSFAKIVVIAFAVIIALSKFGITIAPFIAAIGAAAFGATYALQGPLSNYGAGLAIILGRTFLVGDTITVAGVFGVVETITLAHTTLRTEDGVKITVPNKHIVGEILHNSGEFRIVESSVGISYSADPTRAIEVIGQALAGFPQLQNGPAPQVGIEAFQDSSVAIGYRYWAPTQRYIETMHGVNLAVYQALGQANISIPFPQRVVTLLKDQNLS